MSDGMTSFALCTLFMLAGWVLLLQYECVVVAALQW